MKGLCIVCRNEVCAQSRLIFCAKMGDVYAQSKRECDFCTKGDFCIPRIGFCTPKIRKILVSVNFLSAILGPKMAAPILWTPGKNASVLQENHVHKIQLLRGGGVFWVLGGGSADFIFMGARIFLKKWHFILSVCTPDNEFLHPKTVKTSR